MKKRILFCAENGELSTGYGNYTRSLLTRLYDTNKYDIAELSCYKTSDTPKKFPWKIYPNAVKNDDPRSQNYKQVLQNQFGQWRFDLVVAHFKPDIVIDFRDIFMSLFQRTSVFRDKFHWVLAPTIDSFPVRAEWVDSLSNCDTLLTHTHWAKTEIEQRYRIDVSGVVKDSIDTDVFAPRNKIAIRQELGIDDIDAFIIGSVMRNQKRKLIPELFRILSQIIVNNPNAYLYLHTSYPELSGWNIPELLIEHDVHHRVLFTYSCKKCQHTCSLTWKGEVYRCPKCKTNELILPSSSKGVSDEILAKIYNSFDAYIQYSICEGFGIPPLEAASCGVPVLTVDHGAMKELGKDLGAELVPVKQIYREQENGSDRVYPDNDSCIKKIQSLINQSEIDRLKLKEKYREQVLSKHSWDFTAIEFENIIDEIPMLEPNRWKPISKEHFDNIIQKNEVNNNTNRQLVYGIVENVLETPELKKSFFVQSIVKALDNGYILDNDTMTPYNKQDAITTLEMWFNNKSFLNRFLENNKLLTNQDFLNYS